MNEFTSIRIAGDIPYESGIAKSPPRCPGTMNAAYPTVFDNGITYTCEKCHNQYHEDIGNATTKPTTKPCIWPENY